MKYSHVNRIAELVIWIALLGAAGCAKPLVRTTDPICLAAERAVQGRYGKATVRSENMGIQNGNFLVFVWWQPERSGGYVAVEVSESDGRVLGFQPGR